MLSPPFNFNIEIRKPKEQAWDGTPLHHACYFAHPETVKLLLEKGADPQAVHGYGGNALTTTVHAATHSRDAHEAMPRHLETVGLLAGYFSREALQKSAGYARGEGFEGFSRRLEELAGGRGDNGTG